MIRVLVLDRDRATCESIAAGLAASEDVESAGTALSVDEVLAVLGRPGKRVDVVVASATLRNDGALELARRFRGEDDAPSLVVTGLEATDAAIVQYLEAGVAAYLTDELSLSGLLLILRLLDRGEVLVAPPTAHLLIRRLHDLASLLEGSGMDVSALSELTPREEEVLDLLGKGFTNKEIADELYIGVGTVKSHVHSILKKLNVRDREEARKVLLLSRSAAGGEDEAAEPDASARA